MTTSMMPGTLCPVGEQPDNGRQNHEDRADLRQAQNQGNGRQKARLGQGTPAAVRAMPVAMVLCKRRQG